MKSRRSPLFRDVLPTLTNLGSYATFTDRADDVTDPRRRAERDSLALGSHDFTVKMRFLRETGRGLPGVPQGRLPGDGG